MSAEEATRKAGEFFYKKFSESNDRMLADRAGDVYDISDSIIGQLGDNLFKKENAGIINPTETTSENDKLKLQNEGINDSEKPNEMNNPAESDLKIIMVSEYISVSRIILEGKEKIAGVVATKDSVNSHASIVARSMGIPAIVKCNIPLNPSIDGTEALIDGFDGKLFIQPDEETKKKADTYADNSQKEEKTGHLDKIKSFFTGKGEGWEKTFDEYSSKKSDLSAEDFFESNEYYDNEEEYGPKVYANIHDIYEADDAFEEGADGIGLFRTEFIYLSVRDYPSENEQFEIYKKVAETAAGKKVIIRTADLGSDKKASYMKFDAEENPAMGLRGIRYSFLYPEMFKDQLKAILKASRFGNLSVMFPMITSLEEVLKIKEYLEETKTELRDKNIPFDENIKIGIMIETPASALIADELAKEVDFFSVGSNDLLQYTFGADRLNDSVEKYCNPNHPAALILLKSIAEAAHKNGIKVGICGEIASDEKFTEILSRMGYDYLSVSLPELLSIKKSVKKNKS